MTVTVISTVVKVIILIKKTAPIIAFTIVVSCKTTGCAYTVVLNLSVCRGLPFFNCSGYGCVHDERQTSVPIWEAAGGARV